MLCKVHIEVPGGCATTPRYVCLSWGYSKIAISGLLFFISFIPVIDTLGSLYYGYLRNLESSIMFLIVAALFLTDIIHSVMLVVGTHMKKVNNLKKFYSYSKALWIVTPVTITIFAILLFSEIIWVRSYLARQLYTELAVMCISLVFQTFVMGQVAQEIGNIENNGSVIDDERVTKNKRRVFDGEFSLNFGTTNEKEIKYSKMVGETETNTDSAKLNV